MDTYVRYSTLTDVLIPANSLYVTEEEEVTFGIPHLKHVPQGGFDPAILKVYNQRRSPPRHLVQPLLQISARLLIKQ